MSQVWYEEVSLESVVSRATHVLLVERADPFLRKEEIPIDRPTYDGSDCPPYVLTWRRFAVIETIRAPIGFDASTVELTDADWDSALDTHIAYYVDGVSESPIVMSYEPRAETSEGRLIVFAREGDRGLGFVVAGAMEGAEMLDEVRSIIADKTNPDFQVFAAEEDTEAETDASWDEG